MVKSIFQLIRPLNLLIMAGTMYLVRYGLIQTQLNLQILDLQMEDIDFAILSISIVLIAAAGYIINDYFDITIDSINRPERVIIGKTISPKTALSSFFALSIIGVALGFYEAYKIHVIQLGFIHLLTVGLLWFYSSVFKKVMLIGNLIVSLLCAIIIIIPLLYEPYRSEINASFILAFAIFALIISLVREIIKDMEDAKGDAEAGCKTLPIVAGNTISKSIVIGLSLLVVVSLVFVQKIQIETQDKLSFWYFTIAIQLPLLTLIYLTVKAKEKNAFSKASSVAKIIMIGGMLSMLVFRYTLLGKL